METCFLTRAGNPVRSATEPSNRSNLSSLDRRRAEFFDHLEVGELTRARGRDARILFRLDDTRDVGATCRAFSIARKDLYLLAVAAGEDELASLAKT